MRPPRPRYDCSAGRHHSRSDVAHADHGVVRSECVRCGCALFRTDASRRWVFSGALGTPAPADRSVGLSTARRTLSSCARR